jgi:hypothetical protein
MAMSAAQAEPLQANALAATEHRNNFLMTNLQD